MSGLQTYTSAYRLGVVNNTVNKASKIILLAVSMFSMGVIAAPAEEQVNVVDWNPEKIRGSIHDMTSLNRRAGVSAMAGMAFTDYSDPCIYCHVPDGMDENKVAPGQIPQWNRYRPMTQNYTRYTSMTATQPIHEPGDVSLLCLSCHDGTMALDRVVHKPTQWENDQTASLHMRMNASDDIRSCGKCHDGSVAHAIQRKVIGIHLADDHPIGIPYKGLNPDAVDYRPPDGLHGFDNSVTLFDGNIECATCHDVHSPQNIKLLRETPLILCNTCHLK